MLTLLRQPKWIIFTLLVPVGVALCLLAADWQYNRHVNRSAEDARIRANTQITPVPIADVLAVDEALSEDLQFRQVTATGQFDDDATVLVRRRVLNGSAGFWVVSPLVTPQAQTVAVLRGWLPMTSGALESPAVPPAPTGDVTVVGWLQPTQTSPDPAPADLPAGQVAALDTAVLAGGSAAFSPYVVAAAMAPPDSGELTVVPVPDLGLGPHLAYAWQWVAFAALLPLGWVLMLRRELRENRAERDLARTHSAELRGVQPGVEAPSRQ